MGLLNFLNKWRGNIQIAELSEEVAARSRDAVWQRVRQRLATLGVNEARGYIRARSAPVLQDEMDRLILGGIPVKPADRPRLIEAATESVIRLIASQQRMVRPAATRPESARTRRAA